MTASMVLGLALLVASASAADSGTCPPLQGVVLHLIATNYGYLLPVDVAGTPRLFQLDLGSAYSKLDETVATELKLPLKKAPIEVVDDLGAFAQVATVPSIKLGAVMRGESQMLVGAHREGWGSTDGVAGMNMFYGFDVELDLAHNRLGLYLPRDCSFQPFWPSDVFGEAEFTIEGTGRIILPLKLDEVEIHADLEMVSHRSKMPLEAARILYGITKEDSRLKPEMKDQRGGDEFRFPFKVLTGGDRVTVENPQIYIVQKEGMLCSGIAGQRQWRERSRRGETKWCAGGGDVSLGTNVLSKLHLFFSTKDKKVYFTAAEPSVQTASPETKGQYDAAIADYSQVIRLKPNDANAFNERGDAYRHKGQYDAAIADYSQAISLKPDFAFAFFFRGMAYFNKGQDDAAIADYSQFIRLKPDFAFAFDARGDAYQHKGQYDTAIADYSQAISLKQDDAIAFNSRCWTRAVAGRQLDEALADCNKSLQLRPNDASVLDSRGFVYFRMRNYPAAIADYNTALAGNPKSASSFFVRGLTKQKLGDAAGGDGDIAAAKKLYPNIAEEYAKYGVTQK